MKRLMFGLAAGVSLAAITAQGIGYSGCVNVDLATYNYTAKEDVNSVWCNSNTFLLSKDLIAPLSFVTAFGSSSTTDFQGHTLYPTNSNGTFSFYFSNNATRGMGENFLYLKNGTIDGSKLPSPKNLPISGCGSYTSGNVTLDNMTIQNFSHARLCKEDIADSTITFKNGSVIDYADATGNVTFFAEMNQSGSTISTEGCNNTISFESGSQLKIGYFCSDWASLDGSFNYNDKLRFTGDGTVATVTDNIDLSRGMTGFTLEVLDGALFDHTKGWIGFGYANAKRGKIVVDNATLKCKGRLVMGCSKTSTGHQVLFNNATVQFDQGIAVGNNSDNNTLIVSNSDFSAVQGIGLGACNGSQTSGCRSNNKAYFCGQKMVFNGWPLINTGFYGSNNLLCFDDCTLTDARNYSFNVYNPNPSESGGDEWEGNEIRLENGAVVTLGNIRIGEYNESSDQPVRYQKVTVGNNSTLNIQGSFIISHVGNQVVLSNGTLRVGSSNPSYAEFDLGLRGSGATQTIDKNVLEFHGDHPQVSVSGDDTIVSMQNATIMRFYLPEDGEYKAPPINTPKVWIRGYVAQTDTAPEHIAPTLEFPNITALQETLAGTKEITLIHTTTSLSFPDDIIEATNASLPTGCSIRVKKTSDSSNAGDLILTVKGALAQKPGAILIIK